MQKSLSISRVVDRVGHLTRVIEPTLRQGCVTACQLVKTIWVHRALLNELDALTDIDLRDLSISPRDIARIAWDEARRRDIANQIPHV